MRVVRMSFKKTPEGRLEVTLGDEKWDTMIDVVDLLCEAEVVIDLEMEEKKPGKGGTTKYGRAVRMA